MNIHVNLYASFTSLLPEGSCGNACNVALETGATVGRLLAILDIDTEAAKIIFRNGVHAKLDDTLEDGDRVAVFPPIAGG